MFKKALAFILALFIIFVVVACGKTEETNENLPKENDTALESKTKFRNKDKATEVQDSSEQLLIEEELLAAILEEIVGTEGKITKEDMKRLTSLQAINKGITDLSGLEYAENLEELNLSQNQINDISPLAGLTKLKELDLMSNQISDINHLGNLSNLEILRLASNEISDISILAKLTNLRILTLADNKINDISLSQIFYLEGLSWSADGHYVAFRVLDDCPFTIDVQIINVSDANNDKKFYSFSKASSKEYPFRQGVAEASPHDLYQKHEWVEEGDALLVTIGEGVTYS